MTVNVSNLYDIVMRPLEYLKLKGIREELLKSAKGRVLEIGSGTGANFPLYTAVDSVTAIEPSQPMIEQSNFKKEKSTVRIEVIKASAEELPFADDSFDTVVGTLVFCTIPDVDQAFKEIKRVCKPGGKILLFEHVKMNNTHMGRLQEFLTPSWRKVFGGCCLNRQTLKSLKKHDFQISEVKSFFNGLFIFVEAYNK